MFQKNNEGLKMRKQLNMHKIGTEEHPENLQESVRNPFSNVLMTDYEDNPEKEKYDATYDESEEKRLNDRVKQFIMENNKDNKDIGKIFNNLGDNFDFENWTSLLNQADYTITPESGCTHIASLTSSKLCVIYDADNSPKSIMHEYAPWNKEYLALETNDLDLNKKLLNFVE